MTDHFSGVARAYARYRPGYPPALFAYLAALAPGHDRAWDCGAGSGQAAEGLCPHFGQVVATDISRLQLAGAPGPFRVVSPAERSALAGSSMDLVVVAQALHWLDLPAFYAEVRRVLRPGGALAVWSYDLAQLGEAKLDELFRDFYDTTVGDYWPPERRLVDDRYRGIPFPFAETTVPSFAMEADWTLDEVLGYVGTWSAVTRYRAIAGIDPVPSLGERLRTAWGPAERRRISWPVAMRVGRPLRDGESALAARAGPSLR